MPSRAYCAAFLLFPFCSSRTCRPVLGGFSAVKKNLFAEFIRSSFRFVPALFARFPPASCRVRPVAFTSSFRASFELEPLCSFCPRRKKGPRSVMGQAAQSFAPPYPWHYLGEPAYPLWPRSPRRLAGENPLTPTPGRNGKAPFSLPPLCFTPPPPLRPSADLTPHLFENPEHLNAPQTDTNRQVPPLARSNVALCRTPAYRV